jgi:hypothetical protein
VSNVFKDEVLTMHPAGHFWTFQAIETAAFVALAIGHHRHRLLDPAPHHLIT